MRLATVRWQRPSAVSDAGETVAAFAAHIGEAESALASKRVSAPAALVPRLASHALFGRRWGRKMPCGRPSAMFARILAIPCSAAARGCDGFPALPVAARL